MGLIERIERQAAIDALGERPMVWTDNDSYSLGQRNQYDADKLAIETVPSAEPERKTGRWIAHDLSIKDVPTECCSECCEWSYGWHEKYCPKCGSPMEVEHDSN